MRLNVQTDYALRVLMFLAAHDDTTVTTAEIADRFAISQNHLTKVAQALAREALVETARGRQGGLRLARPAGEISVGEVVRALEGDFAIAACFDGGKGDCLIFPACRLRGVFQNALEAFLATLDEVTIHDLVTLNGDLKTLLARPVG